MTRNSGNKKQTKGQRREELERKRDNRARRNALKKERKAKEYLENDENFVSFSNQLEALSLKIKDIPGDGNCLFRSLGDQLVGDHATHARHRRETVKYMREHRSDFEPFMEDNVSFDEHLQDLSKLGTYGGNDSIVAFARNHGVNVVIHQLNEPRWVINGAGYSYSGQVIELHISYHNGEHYSSVRHTSDNSTEPAWIKHRQLAEINVQCLRTKEEGKTSGKGKTKDAMFTLCESESIDQMLGDNQTPEELVMTATGCQDLAAIAQALKDNNYDVDASISYVLQLMCVAEETGCLSVGLFDCNVSQSDKNAEEVIPSSCKFAESEHSNTETVMNGTRNYSGSNETFEDCMCTMDGIVDELSSRTDKSTDTTLVQGNEQSGAMQGLTKSLKEKSSPKNELKVEIKYEHQGARPKDTEQKSRKGQNSQANAHLSNKKRKELAKKEKKRQREERRKNDVTNSCPDPSVNSGEQTTSCSVVPDLGILAI